MVYQLAYVKDKTSFARVVKLVDTRDLKSLASNSVPVQVRLRVPLYSPILSYRTAKASDIRGFVVSGVLHYPALYCPALYCPALSIPIHSSDVHYHVHWFLNVHWGVIHGSTQAYQL